MKRFVLLGGLLALLAACGSPMEYHLAKTMHQDCNWVRWFADMPICHTYAEPQKRPAAPEPVCYRTIGAVECHAEPIEGWTPIVNG
jgi:hypothetical protein